MRTPKIMSLDGIGECEKKMVQNEVNERKKEMKKKKKKYEQEIPVVIVVVGKKNY